jgi:hypothetical protein
MQATHSHWLRLFYRSALVLVVTALALVPVSRAEPAINLIPPLHLPLVLGDPAGPQPTDFANGDFEAGPVAWQQGSTGGFANVTTTHPNYMLPHNGTWLARLGGADEETGYIQQTILINAARPLLVLYYYIDAETFGGSDSASVTVNGSLIANYNLCTEDILFDWVPQTINLGAYAGQIATIRFEVTTDESTPSSWFLDDISMQAVAP